MHFFQAVKTYLYVDGFNLYFSAVKGTPLKWLNIRKLAGTLFPRNEIVAVRYFTAKVNPTPDNPHQLDRQLIYWRALQTVPDTLVIEGHFRTRVVSARVVQPPPPTIRVFKNEEKGSDVNLGCHLLLDGCFNRYEAAIVITGDSDLVTPICMVREELGKPVGVLNPQRLSGPN